MWRRSRLSARPKKGLSKAGSTHTSRCVALFSSSSADDNSVAASSALRQQLEFCCLVSGWDTPCTTCPFDWRGFDSKKRYRILRRSPASKNEMTDAMEILGMSSSENGVNTKHQLTLSAVKAAFRQKALEWHPDCNSDPAAEDKFREILDAYELLLAVLSSP